eukprot:367433_1
MSEGPLYIITNHNHKLSDEVATKSLTNTFKNGNTHTTEHIRATPKQIELTVMENKRNITFRQQTELSKHHLSKYSDWIKMKRWNRTNLIFSILLFLIILLLLMRIVIFNYDELNTFMRTAFGYDKYNNYYHYISQTNETITNVNDLVEQCSINIKDINGWFNGNSFDPYTFTWNDLSQYQNNINSDHFRGNIKVGLFANDVNLKYLYGSKDEQIFTPYTLRMNYDEYSFIYIAKYWSNDQNNIFVSDNNKSDVKWIVGFDDRKNGISKHGNKWVAQNINESEYDPYSWVIGIDQKNSFQSYGYSSMYGYVWNSDEIEADNKSDNNTSQFIHWGININEKQFSDFSVGTIIILNNSLNEIESECIINYLTDKYKLNNEPNVIPKHISDPFCDQGILSYKLGPNDTQVCDVGCPGAVCCCHMINATGLSCDTHKAPCIMNKTDQELLEHQTNIKTENEIKTSQHTIKECDSWHFVRDYKPSLIAWFKANEFDGEKLYDLSGNNHHIYENNEDSQHIKQFKFGEQIYPSITYQTYLYFSTLEWIKLYKLFANNNVNVFRKRWFTMYLIMRYNGNDQNRILQIDNLKHTKSNDLTIEKKYNNNWFIGKFQIYDKSDNDSLNYLFQNINTGEIISHQKHVPVIKLALNTYNESEFALAELIMLENNEVSSYADCIELYLSKKYHIETYLNNLYSYWSCINIVIYFLSACVVIFFVVCCKRINYNIHCCECDCDTNDDDCVAWNCTCAWINIIVMSGYALVLIIAQIFSCCICCSCFAGASTYCICHFTHNISQLLSCWIPHRSNYFPLNINILLIVSYFLLTLRVYFIFFYHNIFLYETFIFQYSFNALLLTLMVFWVSSHTHLYRCDIHKHISIILTFFILICLLIWVVIILGLNSNSYYNYSDFILYFVNTILIVYQFSVHPGFIFCSPAFYQSILFIFVFSFNVYKSFAYVYVDLIFQAGTLIAGLLLLIESKSNFHPGYRTNCNACLKEMVLTWYSKLEDIKMDTHSFENDKILFQDEQQQKIQKYRKDSDEYQSQNINGQAAKQRDDSHTIPEGISIQNWANNVSNQFDCLKSEICLNNYYSLSEDIYENYKENVTKLSQKYKQKAKRFYFIDLLAIKIYLFEPQLKKQLELAFIDKYNQHRKESFFLWATYFDSMANAYIGSINDIQKGTQYYAIHSPTYCKQLPLVCSESIICLYYYVSQLYPNNDFKIIGITFKYSQPKGLNITWMFPNYKYDNKKNKDNNLNIFLIFDNNYKISKKSVVSSLRFLSNWCNTNQLKQEIIKTINWKDNKRAKKVRKFMKEFEFLDIKQDGILDIEELMKFILWKEQYRLQYNDAFKKAKYIMRNINSNGITKDEWIYAIYCGLMLIDSDHIKSIFKELLINDKEAKTISKNDLLSTFTDINENKMQNLIDEIVYNSNGIIHWNEFKRAMRFSPLYCNIKDELVVWGFIKNIEKVLPKSCLIPNSIYKMCYYFVYGYFCH